MRANKVRYSFLLILFIRLQTEVASLQNKLLSLLENSLGLGLVI